LDYALFQLDVLPRVPLIPGLEAVGRVERVGPNVTLVEGTRVGISALASSCGTLGFPRCEWCERGLEHQCRNRALHGWHHDGLLARWVVVAASHVVELSEADDPFRFAPLLTTGWTALAAVRASGFGAGHRLFVLGVGGLGHLVIQVARHLGLQVSCDDVDAERVRFARSLKGDVGCEPESQHAAIVCAPSAQAIQRAARSVMPGGCVVLAASAPSVRFDLSLFDCVMRGLTLRTAFLGSRSELLEVVAWAREGRITPHITRLPLESVSERFWMLRDGGFTGRLVVDLTPTSELK
jgi:propanol-preferring alcohol dehydrogenase